jgi:arsenate reductase
VGLDLEVHSAGTRATSVNPKAVEAMLEVGVDLSNHTSKTLYEVPDPWNFDVVLTVCDKSAESCPVYPARTKRLHRGFRDPAGAKDEPQAFREVSDEIRPVIEKLVLDLKADLAPALT